METKCYSFNSYNEQCSNGIYSALENLNSCGKKPILICIGSDLVLGDSLGPLVGTMLRQSNVSSFVYGTLNYPITAKEIEYAKEYLKSMHPNSVSIAIDAAVGNPEDIGLIKVVNTGLKPGLGVDKNLGQIGDISIVGVVAGRSKDNYNLFNLTRLNLIYKMANCITEGLKKYIAGFYSCNQDNSSIVGA